MMSEEEKQRIELLKQLFGDANIKAEQIVFGNGVYVEHIDNHYYPEAEAKAGFAAGAAADGTGNTASTHQETEEECPWIGEILNSFYSDKERALEFVRTIENMKPTQVTALVNEWLRQKKISPCSCHRDLWRPLHEHGLYEPSESNWNRLVGR